MKCAKCGKSTRSGVVVCHACQDAMQVDQKALLKSLTYFEDAVRESDEIIAECSPDFRAELIKQKRHFEAAIAAMRVYAIGTMSQEG